MNFAIEWNGFKTIFKSWSFQETEFGRKLFPPILFPLRSFLPLWYVLPLFGVSFPFTLLASSTAHLRNLPHLCSQVPCPASATFPHRLALSPLLPAYLSSLRPLRYSSLIAFPSPLFCSPRLPPPGQPLSLPPYPSCPVAQHTHTSIFLCHLFFPEPPRDSLLSLAVPCTSRPKTGRAETLPEPVSCEKPLVLVKYRL